MPWKTSPNHSISRILDHLFTLVSLRRFPNVRLTYSNPSEPNTQNQSITSLNKVCFHLRTLLFSAVYSFHSHFMFLGRKRFGRIWGVKIGFSADILTVKPFSLNQSTLRCILTIIVVTKWEFSSIRMTLPANFYYSPFECTNLPKNTQPFCLTLYK